MPKLLWATMNCLFDTSSGANISVREMLTSLAKTGWEVKVLSGYVFDAESGKTYIEDKLSDFNREEIVWLNVQDGEISHEILLTESWQMENISSQEEMTFWRRFLVELAVFKPDVLFSYGARPLNLLMFSEARYRNILNVVYLVNGTYESNRWCLDVDHVVTDTTATRDLYSTKLDIVATPYGKFVNRDKIRRTVKQEKRILFINPVPAKGAFIVAQFVGWMCERRPDIIFEIVGSRGGWEPIWSSYLEHSGLEGSDPKNVIVTEHTSDMKSVYSRAHLLLVPSLWYESGARVIAEAMINGIPCVATDTGGNKELVGAAGTILSLPRQYHSDPYSTLLPEGSVEEICRTIVQYFDDPNFYTQKSNQCKTQEAMFCDSMENARKLDKDLRGLLSGLDEIDFESAYRNYHKMRIKPVGMYQVKDIPDRFDDLVHKVIKKAPGKGVYLLSSGEILKCYKRETKSYYQNERNWYLKFDNLGITPTLLDYNDNEYWLKLTEAGEALNSVNRPKNYLEKLEKIKKALAEKKCSHNDLKPSDFIVKDDDIKVIDFEHATTSDDNIDTGELGGNKVRVFSDQDFLSQLKFLTDPDRFSTDEVHAFILWDNREKESVRASIARNFEILIQIEYDQRAINLLGGQKTVLSKIYESNPHAYGLKGRQPFSLFVVLDKSPLYKKSFDKNAGRDLIVNQKMHKTKLEIRKGRQGYIHGSNNLEESRDALEALTMYQDRYPIKFFEKNRNRFSSLKDLFSKLSDTGIKYVVMRNFELLPDEFKIDEHGDIDILVEDYFLTKRLLGGYSYKHLLP